MKWSKRTVFIWWQKGTKDKIKTALRTVPGIRDVKYDTKNEEGTLGLTLYMTPGAEIREDIFYAMVKSGLPNL